MSDTTNPQPQTSPAGKPAPIPPAPTLDAQPLRQAFRDLHARHRALIAQQKRITIAANNCAALARECEDQLQALRSVLCSFGIDYQDILDNHVTTVQDAGTPIPAE